tara:strand:- start:4882 stop:5052 length:171 start_codon:yes stop_codon:yes gene_type:complete
MKAGTLVRVDYGEALGFQGPFLSLGPVKEDSEWIKLLGRDGKKIESHIDYIYPMKQ